ncbi:hypothetical protein [Bradyrhizobium sp. LHD-71]|uniref:hypothetical protein n=1 Tax=Bradyrhizobium sp. LHD-71 TaxID=3072141 RepID=UPI00280C8049|nr:hypothetical protein [Bradyrhizobium sp. LHD-71]MDQ8730009.1 hypothetical protein [Bradyrhizobium sp. LHD-71]
MAAAGWRTSENTSKSRKRYSRTDGLKRTLATARGDRSPAQSAGNAKGVSFSPNKRGHRTARACLRPAASLAGNEMVTKIRRIVSRLPTHIADIKENPRWLPMFTLGRVMLFRKLAWRLNAPPAQLDLTNTLFPEVDTEQVAERLRRDGLFQGFRLPADISSEISSFARRTPCFGNFDRKLELLARDHRAAEFATGRAILTGHFFERVLDCEAARRLQQDPLLLQIAQNYLGGEARVTATRLWWSFPTERASDYDLHFASQNRFHFDLDDWRMIKYFFYIEAVDQDSGPHLYVLGSHRQRLLRHQFTLLVGQSSEDIERIYGREAIVELTGAQGFGFVEDPFGFHTGSLARSGPRLALEIAFGVSEKLHRRFHGEPVVRSLDC